MLQSYAEYKTHRPHSKHNHLWDDRYSASDPPGETTPIEISWPHPPDAKRRASQKVCPLCSNYRQKETWPSTYFIPRLCTTIIGRLGKKKRKKVCLRHPRELSFAHTCSWLKKMEKMISKDKKWVKYTLKKIPMFILFNFYFISLEFILYHFISFFLIWLYLFYSSNYNCWFDLFHVQNRIIFSIVWLRYPKYSGDEYIGKG